MTINAPPLLKSLPDADAEGVAIPGKVRGALTLSSGGAFQSAETGQRVAIEEGDIDKVKFYTGDSFEENPGDLRSSTAGSGTTRQLVTALHAPDTTGDSGGMSLTVRSESFDDSTTPPIVFIDYLSGGGSTQVPRLQLGTDVRLAITGLGTAALPSIGIGGGFDDGWYSAGASAMSAAIAGVEVFEIEATRVDFDEGALKYITIPVKTDTGDPTGGQEGDMYVNTQDNAVRVFADAAWRDVVAW